MPLETDGGDRRSKLAMSDEGVIAVWSGSQCISLATRIPPEGIVIGRELLGDTTDDRLSRLHARIARLDGRLVMSDAGSRNGTFVNESAIEADSVEVVPGAVIRTGRTVWTIVADVARTDAARMVRAIVDAARAVAPEIAIHATLVEACLCRPPTHRPLLDLVAAAARVRASEGGSLRGADLEIAPVPGLFAVFPGVKTAIWAARRIAAKLSGSTTRQLIGGNSLVEARTGDRRVAVTCPPSTAFLVEIYDGDALVAAGHTIEDKDALAVASAWLAGAALTALVQESPFLRAEDVHS